MSYKDAFTEELVLPSNLKAECAVLASVLLDPAALPRVAPVLAAEDFSNQKHQRIYSAMLALRDRSAEIEPVALLMELNGAGDGTGPDPITAAYISGLDDGELDAQNVKEYARTVKEWAVRRRFISAAQKLDQRARSPEANVRMLAEDVGAEIQIVGRSLQEPATAGQRSPLKSHTLAELEAMEIPERELIVSPVLARQETAFIYGPKGTSKTWTAVGIAAVAAQGGGARFLNFVNDGPGVLTVYVDGEMLSRDIRQRVRDVCRTSNLDPGGDLRIWTPDAQPEGTPPLNLFTEEGREMLENHLADIEEEKGRKVELVVIDNLRTLCPGWEENAAESFMPIAVWTIRLRAKGKATILLHHSNKTGGYSGNTAIVSTVHAILKIARPEGYTADQGASFDLIYEWTRARPDGLENFSARLEGDAWSVKQTGHVADELIRILSAQGLSIREIADQIGKGRDYVSRRQKKLGLVKGASEGDDPR